MKTVAVIGGGITGLSTMYYLSQKMKEENIEARLVLIEKNPYLGGKMHTEYEKGYTMETGADSIVARYPGVLDLVRELEYETELVYNETGISYIHTNNELHAIPTGSTFGIPMSVESLMESTLLSEEGKMRVLQDADIPNTQFTKESSIGEFLEYFLGEEIVHKQIAPVLAGVYSGNLYELSLNSTLPYLVDYKNEYGSIMKGFEANREKFERSANKKFISFKNGLSGLINRIEEKLIGVAEIFKNLKTTSINKIQEGYEVVFANGEMLRADVVVMALPNSAVKTLIKDEELDFYLQKFTNASAITMYLGFDIPDSILPEDGTGFIVSHNSNLICNASTWTSRKWKHTSTGNLLVRLFYKSNNPKYEELIQMTDEELTNIARNDIQRSLNIEEKPVVVKVTKWINAMPRYDLAHNEALQELLSQFDKKYPNLFIAGCSYFGVGIGACIDNGKTTAEKTIHVLK